jgi:hypothetical protein
LVIASAFPESLSFPLPDWHALRLSHNHPSVMRYTGNATIPQGVNRLCNINLRVKIFRYLLIYDMTDNALHSYKSP